MLHLIQLVASPEATDSTTGLQNHALCEKVRLAESHPSRLDSPVVALRLPISMIHRMDESLTQTILDATGADALYPLGTIQSLWGGYGSLDRYGLTGSEYGSVIVKHVKLPQRGKKHPRGWNTDRSHQRKLRSYQVETAWYRDYSSRCDAHCRVPRPLALEQHKNAFLIVLEDLDSSGYPRRKERVGKNEMIVCLKWLANFHATFMGTQPAGLWKTGTYWHLKTRPDELKAMDDDALKQAAPLLDRVLAKTPFPTLVHGDAKLANFCFSNNGSQVVAVDFQYVGGGCGMKDVAYFISSCLDEHACEKMEKTLLDAYFAALHTALNKLQPGIDPAAVEAAWRPMYPVAWTDFYRFLKGWSPGHWKMHGYSERLAHEVVAQMLADPTNQRA